MASASSVTYRTYSLGIRRRIYITIHATHELLCYGGIELYGTSYLCRFGIMLIFSS